MSAPIRVRYPGVEEDYEATVEDLGMAGMFIAGYPPMAAGTLLHFEFRPSPHWRAVRGRARVVWARHQANADGEPPGMGVRFIELEERGRRAVRRLVETYQTVGDKPLETWTIPGEFTRRTAAEERDALTTQEIVPLSGSTARRRALRWWLPAAVVALLALGWLFRGIGGRPDTTAAVGVPPPTQETEAGARSASPPVDPSSVPAAPSTDAPAATAAVDEAPIATLSEVLSQLVEEWAAAWSSQDVDRYLAFYSSEFVPEGGGSRAAWANQRRERLTRPAFVEVTVDELQVLDEEADMPRTVFTQSYESNTFSDEVAKSLTWVRSEGSWRIVSERAAP